MLPETLKEPAGHLTHTAVDTLYAIYVVQLIIVIITFLLAIPFFYFLGFEHVLFFSTLAGLLKIVPILGPSILMAFLAVYAVSIFGYERPVTPYFHRVPCCLRLP